MPAELDVEVDAVLDAVVAVDVGDDVEAVVAFGVSFVLNDAEQFRKFSVENTNEMTMEKKYQKLLPELAFGGVLGTGFDVGNDGNAIVPTKQQLSVVNFISRNETTT